MHKKYDDLAAEAKRREEKFAQLTDELNILRKEAEIVKATLADSPQAKVSFMF
jgi:ABC-type phosphate transport system auxiliary subunit